MKILVVLAHPSERSLAYNLNRVIVESLLNGGHEVRNRDLYGEGFDPVLSRSEWEDYFNNPSRLAHVYARDVNDIAWADALVLVFPTWAYGPPAILKGWFEKAFLPDRAFTMPGPFGLPLAPKLTNIRRIVCVTSSGSPRWLMWLVGHPIRRMVLRGYRMMLHWGCRTKWFQLYRMDAVSDRERRQFERRVVGYFSRLA